MQATTNHKRSTGEILFDISIIILCVLIFLIVAYPLYFVIIASVSDQTLVSTGKVTLFPRGISFFGYEQIFQDMRIWIGYKNTIIYTVLGTLFNLLLTIPAAYTLSRPEFRARRFLMFFFVFTLFFNGGLIPTYILMKDLSLTNSMWVFILPFAVNVFNLIIARTFFEASLPKEIYESAALDGCTHFKFFFYIAIPLSKSVISVIALYYLVAHWNDFLLGLSTFIRMTCSRYKSFCVIFCYPTRFSLKAEARAAVQADMLSNLLTRLSMELLLYLLYRFSSYIRLFRSILKKVL